MNEIETIIFGAIVAFIIIFTFYKIHKDIEFEQQEDLLNRELKEIKIIVEGVELKFYCFKTKKNVFAIKFISGITEQMFLKGYIELEGEYQFLGIDYLQFSKGHYCPIFESWRWIGWDFVDEFPGKYRLIEDGIVTKDEKYKHPKLSWEYTGDFVARAPKLIKSC